MYQLAKTGRWTGGTTPLGYKSVKQIRIDGNRTREYYTLETDDTQIDTAQLIFSKYMELQSMNALEKYLNEHNITTQMGKRWSSTNVKRILSNPIYCAADMDAFKYFSQLGCNICFTEEDCSSEHGIMPYGRTTNDKRKVNPPEKWMITSSIHKPVLSGKEWIAVQRAIQANGRTKFNGKTNTRVSRNSNAILSGVLRCRCGAYMRPKIYGSGNVYYMCENKDKNGKAACDVANVPVIDLEQVIIDEIFNLDVQSNSVNSKSTDLPASLILSRPYVFDDITMFCGTNGRKLFMDFADFLPFRLPLSTEFQDLLPK